MLEAAELRPSDKVLEVGAGSGYTAALMSRMAGRVYAIERQEALIAPARARFHELGYDNIELRGGDGTRMARGRTLRRDHRVGRRPTYPRST